MFFYPLLTCLSVLLFCRWSSVRLLLNINLVSHFLHLIFFHFLRMPPSDLTVFSYPCLTSLSACALVVQRLRQSDYYLTSTTRGNFLTWNLFAISRSFKMLPTLSRPLLALLFFSVYVSGPILNHQPCDLFSWFGSLFFLFRFFRMLLVSSLSTVFCRDPNAVC